MSILSVLGDAGTVLRSANDADALAKERAYQQQIRDLMLRQGVRQDTTQQQNFDVDQALRNVAPVTIPGSPGVAAQPATTVPYDDAVGDQPPQQDIVEKPAQPAIPATPDTQVPNFAERARIAAANGRPDLYEQNAVLLPRHLKSEGLADYAHALLTGDDPVAATAKFNQSGVSRIDPSSVQWDASKGVLTGKRDNGTDFTFNPRGTLAALGMTPKPIVLAQGANAVDPLTGNTIATGQPRAPRYRPMDEQIAIEQAKAKAREMFGKDSTPSKIKEVQFLADNSFGGDTAKAIEFVYGQRDQSRTAQVLNVAHQLKDTPPYDGNLTVRMAKAEQIVDGLRAQEVSSRGGQSPGKAAATNSQVGDVEVKNFPPTVSDPQLGSLSFTGKVQEGKPIYRNEQGQEFFGSNDDE